MFGGAPIPLTAEPCPLLHPVASNLPWGLSASVPTLKLFSELFTGLSLPFLTVSLSLSFYVSVSCLSCQNAVSPGFPPPVHVVLLCVFVCLGYVCGACMCVRVCMWTRACQGRRMAVCVCTCVFEPGVYVLKFAWAEACMSPELCVCLTMWSMRTGRLWDLTRCP